MGRRSTKNAPPSKNPIVQYRQEQVDKFKQENPNAGLAKGIDKLKKRKQINNNSLGLSSSSISPKPTLLKR